jgi:hypothetical protein
MAHLDQGLDPGLAGRALGDDEDPDRLDGTVPRLGAPARSTTEGGRSPAGPTAGRVQDRAERRAAEYGRATDDGPG